MHENITLDEHNFVCEKLNDIYQGEYLSCEEWQIAYAEQLEKFYEIR